jgi:exonuclease SbcC
MRLTALHLKAFGPFSDQVLPLGAEKQLLVLVHGLNEAGKSSALRAIAGLRFGIPRTSEDKFLHDYKQMRIGGVFVDASGKEYSLMRRKGTVNTLKYADFNLGNLESDDPVAAEIERLLTAGLSADDYHSVFSLDHDSMRKGGRALAKGEGEIGAALFEASSGVENVTKILAELDAKARSHYSPAAQTKNARINMALSEYKTQVEQYKETQVKPTKWEAIAKASREAAEQLQSALQEHNQLSSQQLQLKELISVGPILASLEQATRITQELDDVPLLAETAAAERATAEAGLSDAIADTKTNQAEIEAQNALIDDIELDPDILEVAQSVSRLHAAATNITQLRTLIATAEGDVDSRTKAFNACAEAIDATRQADDLLQKAPTATRKAQIKEIMDALVETERAFLQHEQSAPGEAATSDQGDKSVPDATLLAAVRVALDEVARNTETLQQLHRLPNELKTAERAVDAALSAVNLPDEQAARTIRPLLGATIDHARQQQTELDSKLAEKTKRIEEMDEGISERNAEIDALLAHGKVPTHQDVRDARTHRQEGWNLVKQVYIENSQPDVRPFTKGRALPEVYEESVDGADSLIDELASDTARTARLESIREQLSNIEGDKVLRQGEIEAIASQQDVFGKNWEQTLSQAGIPFMQPAEVRDWQGLLQVAMTAMNNAQVKRDELDQAKGVECALSEKLRTAVAGLGITVVDDTSSLGTLEAVAKDDIKQVELRIQDKVNAAGQAMQLEKQAAQYARAAKTLAEKVEQAKGAFANHLEMLLLGENDTPVMAKARLSEFEMLVAANASLEEAKSRLTNNEMQLEVYTGMAQSIADALSQELPDDLTLAAERWSTRLLAAQDKQTNSNLTEQRLQAAKKALSENQAKETRHQATLNRLCATARVQTSQELPSAEEQSIRKRQATRDANAAADQLTSATLRSAEELKILLAGREPEALRAEETRIAHELIHAGEKLERARSLDETARRELDSISSSDAAAAAADAMASAAATVRNTLPLQIRSRLAHALLQEAVRRFKERSQAPMLKSASEYFAQITGGEFEALLSDDSGDTPAIVGKRRDGDLLSVEAMSEGTRDQLFLALRLAALKLQRDRGVALPVILDDVLMASDDVRSGHIFKALAEFSKAGQVIVFTHHNHLCEVARRNVNEDALAIVELRR